MSFAVAVATANGHFMYLDSLGDGSQTSRTMSKNTLVSRK